jgi:hypothetical protein
MFEEQPLLVNMANHHNPNHQNVSAIRIFIPFFKIKYIRSKIRSNFSYSPILRSITLVRMLWLNITSMIALDLVSTD